MLGWNPSPQCSHTPSNKKQKKKLTAAEQKHFATWRYVSPQTLKVEMGIAKAMEDLEANYKVGSKCLVVLGAGAYENFALEGERV